MSTLEQRLEEMELKQKEMEKQVGKLQAIAEIQYLMGCFLTYWQSPTTRHKAYSFYAERDDSSHESYCGYQVGMEKLKAYLDPPGGFEATGMQEVGTFYVHHLTSPMIVVADDLQTARGLWFSPGCESFGGQGQLGDPLPLWAWGKYNVDFIRVNGEWKVWHTHFYKDFITPFNTSWVDTPEDFRDPEAGAPGAQKNVYDPKGVFQCIPAPPQPYATWTDDRMRP